MKRTMLFVALASCTSLAAYGHGQMQQSSQNEQSEQQSASARQSQSQQDVVKQAQEKLSADGKDVGTPDGKMGPKTQAALKQYQQENGLQASGQLDDQTIAALDLDQNGSAATGGTSSSQGDSANGMNSGDSSSDSSSGNAQE